MTTWILTHGDADGVCSGALALAANPNSHVYFTHPAGLAEDLNVVEPGDSLIVCDISLSENTLGEVLDKLRLVAEHGQLIYIDHHPLPEGLSPYEVPGEFVHGVGVCASELTYRFFEDRLSRDMSRIVVYGAIGDYADDTPYIRRLVQDWDKRVLYFETGILIQALDAIGRNYERKRGLVWMLSENVPPSADDELVELALEQTRRGWLHDLTEARLVVALDRAERFGQAARLWIDLLVAHPDWAAPLVPRHPGSPGSLEMRGC